MTINTANLYNNKLNNTLDFDVTADEYKTISKILNEYLISIADNCNVYVFGSRAKNTARINSDLDLAIELPENNKISSSIIIDVKEAFNNSSLPYSVDIIDLNHVSATFRELVNQEKKIFPLVRDVMGNHPKLRFKADDGSDYPDWEKKKLGEIAKIQRGASPRPIADSKWFSLQSKIGWVRISDVTRSSKYLKITEQYLSDDGAKKSRKVPVGSIIMSICATIGKPIYTTFPVCIHDGFVVFTDLMMNTEYLYYYLQLIEENWHCYGQPGSQVNLNTEIVNNEFIKLPSLLEQQKIANFLTAVDDLITSTKQQLDLMKQYKQCIMQQIFSQKLRFTADDGSDYPDWTYIVLEKLLNYEQPNKYIVNTVDYSKEYLTPVLTAGKSFILGYTNETTGIFDKNLPVIIFDDFTTTNQFVNFSFKVKSSAIKILLPKHDQVNIRYVYERMQIIEFPKGAEHKRYWISEYSQELIDVPCFEEQQKIANFLTSIDDSIQQQTSKLEQTELYKKALLQQML